jgi:hypothetical protein
MDLPEVKYPDHKIAGHLIGTTVFVKTHWQKSPRVSFRGMLEACDDIYCINIVANVTPPTSDGAGISFHDSMIDYIDNERFYPCIHLK